MNHICKEILDLRSHHMMNKMSEPTRVLVPNLREREILEMEYVGNNCPIKPKAPVKHEINHTSSGFFYSHTTRDIEYDYHAPEYLDALVIYKNAMAEYSKVGHKLYLFGMEIEFSAEVDSIVVK